MDSFLFASWELQKFSTIMQSPYALVHEYYSNAKK